MQEEVYFETIKIVDGKIYNLEFHQRRFSQTAGLDIFLEQYINPPKVGFYRCKLIYDKKQILKITYHKYNKKSIKTLKLIAIDFKYRYKYLDRTDIDFAFKERGNCDEIIMVDNKFIRDTSIANIALFKDNTWYTPKTPLLRGTTLQRYLEQDKIVAKDIWVDEIQDYSKIAFMNAMIDFDIMSLEKIQKDVLIVK